MNTYDCKNDLDIKLNEVLYAVTTEVDYEMERLILLDKWGTENYILVEGYHCSCYDFDETTWHCTEVNKKELIKLLKDKKYEESKNDSLFNQDYYNKPVSRSSQLSFRKYCSECELLITDYEGNFLTYSKLNFCFDDEFIGTNFYNLFLQVKPYMNKVVKKIDEPINFDKVKFTKGFDMINAWMNKAKVME